MTTIAQGTHAVYTVRTNTLMSYAQPHFCQRRDQLPWYMVRCRAVLIFSVVGSCVIDFIMLLL